MFHRRPNGHLDPFQAGMGLFLNKRTAALQQTPPALIRYQRVNKTPDPASCWRGGRRRRGRVGLTWIGSGFSRLAAAAGGFVVDGAAFALQLGFSSPGSV